MAMTNYTSKLVATGAIEGFSGKYVKLYVAYKSTQDAATNKSKVYVGMYYTNDLEIGRWGDWNGSYVGKTTLTFDGTVAAKTAAGTHWLVENKTFDVNHNTEGKATATIYWKWGVNSSWGGIVNPSGSFTITLPTIARASAVSAPNCYLGETTTITINKAASSFTHTLQYKISGQSSYTTLVTKTSASSYKFNTSTIADAAYNLMSSTATHVNCEIRCITYSGSTQIGSKTDTVELMGTKSALAPTLNAQIADNDSNIRDTITHNGTVIVKYYSKPAVYFNAKTKYNAEIKSYKVTNGAKSVNADNAIFTDGVESNVFTFTVTDSRGLTTTQKVTLEKDRYWIEAVKPTISFSTTSPELVTENDATTFKFNLTVKGNCYNGLISPVNNTNAETRIYYRYREVNGTWSSWINLADSTKAEDDIYFNENKTTYNVTKEITGLDYRKAYEIQARIFNTLEAINSGTQIKKTTPVFEWGENDFQFNVPIKLGISASYKSKNGGLNMNNSDVWGINGLYFADMSNSGGEGIYFPHDDTNGKHDLLTAYGGRLYFRPNYPDNTTYYKMCITPGDVVSIANNTPFFGFLTSGRTAIIFSIPLNKPLVGVTSATLKGTLQLRGIGGYIYNQASNKTTKTSTFVATASSQTAEGITGHTCKVTGQCLLVSFTFSAALAHNAAGTTATTNNSPVIIVPDGTLDITFS